MDHAKIAYDLVMVALSISLIVFGVVLFLACKKKPVESEETLPVKFCARAYPLMELDVAIGGFNHRRIIGQGRLGTVYAATLSNAELVAVKMIHLFLVLSNAGFGFSSVLKWLSLAQHPNVVPIIRFSEAPRERVVVMEFIRFYTSTLLDFVIALPLSIETTETKSFPSLGYLQTRESAFVIINRTIYFLYFPAH
ncbi:hypothetical protein HN51_001361 [Arachis hypogaea]